ncbi:MAG: SulP family inorganic anion transporter [Chloroflexi bacterium]|nr:SulP family inorganic anion transporter [Chloroflexota bacterium]
MTITKTSIKGSIVPGLSAGLVVGVTELIFAISLGALIFSGQNSYVANGIGLILLGGLPPLLIMSLFSSYKGSLSMPQDASAAILAVMATGILQSMPSASPREKFISVVAVVVVTTLLTGVVFILLGQFRLGSLVRFLPYPVIGGFLAGTGWLLVTGGIGVMSDVTFSFANPGALFQSDLLLRWVPGLVFGFIMLLILNRVSHFLVLPGMLLAIVLFFYGSAFFSRTPLAALSAQGWLLGPFVNGGLLQPMSLADFGLVHWGALLAQAGSMASIMLISTVSLLLNASGVELVVRQDLDLNRELRVGGWANVLSGLLGGCVTFLTLSTTTLSHRIGKGSRLTGLVVALMFCLPLFFGAAALSYVPKMMLGSLLIMFGFSFLYEWVYQSWFSFSRLEYAVILLILIVIATLGYLQGVGLGIVAAVGLFVVNYSRVSVTKHALTGAELQSRFTRSPNQRKILLEQGAKTFVLQLQGFIFFGTANKLLEQVSSRIAQPGETALQFLILDFAKVSGLDSTAMLSFSKMKQILHDRGISILVTGPSAEVLKQMVKGDFLSSDSIYPDLDHGLEWVENGLLKDGNQFNEQTIPLKEMFQQLLPSETRLDELFVYLEKREVRAGEYLMHQADLPDNIYFVESGQVTAQLEYPGKAPVRLETMKSGQVIGEIGFYLGKKRTAAVFAEEPATIYLLSAENLARMEQDTPEVASIFHQLIIQLLAERTTHLIRTVAALEK